MKYSYESFVEALRDKLLFSTGYEESMICYKKADEYPPSQGDRLFVKRQQKNDVFEVCAIHIRKMYESYLEGWELEDIADEIADQIQKVISSGCFDKAADLNDYEKIKDDLFIRLLNFDKNREDLKSSVYRTIGDVALVLYANLGETEMGITSVKIRENMIESWKTEKEQVFEDALVNTYFMSPPRIYSWEKLLMQDNYAGENFMDLAHEYNIHKNETGSCLSTTKRTNGAVAIFLPGVADRLSDLIGGDFYMVFTSVHEVMIHNCSHINPRDLKSVLRETIEETTPEEDFLTYDIYRYNSIDKKFICCEQDTD